MIRKNSLFCKLFFIKSSPKELFQSYMDLFQPELETCPTCGACGRCHVHAYYWRSIGSFQDGAVRWEKIRVMRVRCDSCGHTHAVLPDVIIPYSRYGTSFILHVLSDHIKGRLSADRICDRYGISRNQFCHWLKLWKQHKTLSLGRLALEEASSCSFIEKVTVQTEYSEFSSSFIRRFAKSFLQSHRNPANCRRLLAFP